MASWLSRQGKRGLPTRGDSPKTSALRGDSQAEGEGIFVPAPPPAPKNCRHRCPSLVCNGYTSTDATLFKTDVAASGLRVPEASGLGKLSGLLV